MLLTIYCGHVCEYSIVSVCTRFGVHDTGYSLSPPLFFHSCLAKARARWNESERKPLVSLRLSDAVSLRRTQSVPSRSSLRPERSEKRTLGIRVAVHYTGYSPVPTSEYIRRQYCIYKTKSSECIKLSKLLIVEDSPVRRAAAGGVHRFR